MCSPRRPYSLCTLKRAVWQVLTGLHSSFDPDGMQGRRETDFLEASAVRESEFL